MKVMVTGCGGGGVGEQILKSLLLANKNGRNYQIVAADTSASFAGERQGWTAVTLPPASDGEYFSNIVDTCKELQVSVILPGSEPELTALLSKRSELSQIGIELSANNLDLVSLCMNKELLSLRLRDLGFSVPQSLRVSNLDDISQINFFPAVVKPNVGGRGSAGVYIVQSRNQLAHLIGFLTQDKWFKESLVQEYVGDTASEYTIGVLSDLQGELVGSIGLNRNLSRTLSVREKVPNWTSRSNLGEFLVVSSGVSQGRIGPFPEVCLQAEEIAQALGSTGPLNIQGRFVNGRLTVFEINPRFSGTSYIRALAGFNEVDALLTSFREQSSGVRLAVDKYFESERTLFETITNSDFQVGN